MAPILIMDDQAEVRSALRLLLDEEENLEVVGEAAGLEELLGLLPLEDECLLLLDWDLERGSAVDVMRALRGRTGIEVVVLSSRPEARRAAERAGAAAFVSKGDPPDRLLAAVWAAVGTRKPGGNEDAHHS